MNTEILTAKKVDLLGIEPRTAPNFFNQKMLRENYTTKPQARIDWLRA